ncbi:MAG: MBL fold metallo-hydrolase [Solobacterium sp.]|nr:MBL fold metallo-hydrolase [Solobacterium sp.]
MKLTVLSDNYTYIDRYFLGEPALSFYIEEGDERILFDTGYSDSVIFNAEKMGIDLSNLTAIVLSHGHNDHTRGLSYLWDKYDLTGVKLIAHPLAFVKKRYLGELIGAPFTRAECERHGLQLIDGSKPVRISERLLFLGGIPRVTSFEAKNPLGEYESDGSWIKDDLQDDSAMVYEGEQGLFLITGCSHSGICNMILYACELAKTEVTTGVIGGFHLMEENEQLEQTVRFLKDHTSGKLYPCHCVSLKAKHHMMKELPVEEVGVGMELVIH